MRPKEDIETFKDKFHEKDPAHPVEECDVCRRDFANGQGHRPHLENAGDDLDLNGDTMIIFSSDHGATFEPLAKGAADLFRFQSAISGAKAALCCWGGRHARAGRRPLDGPCAGARRYA